MDAPDLFRPQAIDAAASRYGAPVRPIGLAAWALTGFMVVLLLSVALFLMIGRYTRKETVSGVLQPSAGAARVTALHAGVITEVYVAEGQAVRRGDPILQLSADPTVRNEGAAPTALSHLVEAGADREAAAITEQAKARTDANARALQDLHARRRGLEVDQLQLAESIGMQEDRLRLLRETLEAGRSLNERQLFSPLQLRQREEAVIAAQQGLSAIQREVRRNQASLEQLNAEEGLLKAQMAQASADVAMARAQFDQRHAEHLAEHGTVLVAGKAGRVVALSGRPGSPVQPGRAIAVILPEGASLQAELWVPSRAAGFLQPGDRVRLMYDAFPYQKFGVGGGAVVLIAGAPTDPADLPVPIETSESLYRILVSLDADSVDGYGRRWRLTPGMRLSADLILDDRSLWEWLFDPIFAARRRGGG